MQSIHTTDKVFSFQLPRKILFGVKVSEKVGLEAKATCGKRALLVTDKGLAKTGVPQKIEKTLAEEGLSVSIFDEVEPEPFLEVAEKTAKVARKEEYDIVVGVGGGSVLDMAKIAAIAVTNPGCMRQYVGVDFVKKTGIPSILLPTTSGTGSEVTNVAVVTVAEDEMKNAVISSHMLATVAMVDPTLAYTLPPRLTASTGLDALSHALEALMSVHANPITDALALQAIRLIFAHLPTAYRKGDPESRYAMSLGAMVAGMAFGNSGVCLGHAAAYSFSVTYKVHHGLSCGLVLPFALEFNAPAIPEKLPQIAAAMNLEAEKLKPEELPVCISAAILRLAEEVQLPRRLRDIGIPREALEKLANKILTFKRVLSRNPRPISREEALRLFEEMW